jgi:hypothetical protein
LQYTGGNNLNLGRAAVGGIIAGPVGAALGGTTGQRNVNAVCQTCGNIFSHQLTQRNLSVARKYLGVDLDFSNKNHRYFYKIASGDLRNFGRIDVVDAVNIRHRWEMLKKHAKAAGLSYDKSYIPAGAIINSEDKEPLPQPRKGFLEELSDSLVKLGPYAIVLSLLMLSVGNGYWWVPVIICYFYYVPGMLIIVPLFFLSLIRDILKKD